MAGSGILVVFMVNKIIKTKERKLNNDNHLLYL